MINNIVKKTVSYLAQLLNICPRLHLIRPPLMLLAAVTLLQACTAVSTFPTIARPGDTVSVMVGGWVRRSTQSNDKRFTHRQ